MTIRRNPRPERYTVVSNSLLEDPNLNWAAKGMLCYLLSKPDNWTVNPLHLERQTDDGQTRVRAIVKTLETAGYMVRRRNRLDDGTFEWETVVYDAPISGSSTRGFSTSGEAPPIVSTELATTDVTTTENTLSCEPTEPPLFEDLAPLPKKKVKGEYTAEFETMWAVYPRGVDKKGAFKKWETACKKDTIENLTRAAGNYAHLCAKERRAMSYILHAATFFGPDEKWRDYVTAPAQDWKSAADNVDQDRSGGGLIDHKRILKELRTNER